MKKKLQREGIFKEMKQRRAYEKPSEKRLDLLMNQLEGSKKCCERELRSKDIRISEA